MVLAKSQVDVKKTFGKQVSEEMRARLKAGIPGNKIMRGDFKWERALEIVQEVFVDSLHQAKQHQDFRGFGQGRGGHGYKRGQGFHRGGLKREELSLFKTLQEHKRKNLIAFKKNL